MALKEAVLVRFVACARKMRNGQTSNHSGGGACLGKVLLQYQWTSGAMLTLDCDSSAHQEVRVVSLWCDLRRVRRANKVVGARIGLLLDDGVQKTAWQYPGKWIIQG